VGDEKGREHGAPHYWNGSMFTRLNIEIQYRFLKLTIYFVDLLSENSLRDRVLLELPTGLQSDSRSSPPGISPDAIRSMR
jgi:hypothetical protein